MGIFDFLRKTKVPQLSVREAYQKLQDDSSVVIVDVRQPAETKSGVVPGAILIPLTEFDRRMNELPRDKPVLTICQSSHRSPFAARKLSSAGYDVCNVSGGMNAWRKAGLPVKKK